MHSSRCLRFIGCFTDLLFYRIRRSRNLTYIPQSIGDLVGFCVIPERLEQANLAGGRLFSRTKTTPIHTQSQSRSFERTASITESTMAREEIQLYLASNQIRTLPRELFNLTKMTVLSLRRSSERFSYLLTHVFSFLR